MFSLKEFRWYPGFLLKCCATTTVSSQIHCFKFNYLNILIKIYWTDLADFYFSGIMEEMLWLGTPYSKIPTIRTYSYKQN